MYTKSWPDYTFDKMCVYATEYGDITPFTAKGHSLPFDRLQVMLRRSSYGTCVSFTPCRRVGQTVSCTLGPDRDESGFVLTLRPDAKYDARLVREAKRTIKERLGEIAHAFDVGNDGEIAGMFLSLLTEEQYNERNEWREAYGRV